MESQLRQQGAADRIKEVLAEVPHVRRDAGFPPLVTPSSQIVGTQAVFNVMMGRYKVMTGEFADLMLGYYGDTDRAARPGGRRAGAASTRRRSRSPAGRPTCSSRSGTSSGRRRSHSTGCDGTDEDVLTYAMFPQVATEVLRRAATRGRRTSARRGREAGPKTPRRRPPPAAAPRADDGQGPVRSEITYDVKLGGQDAQGDGDAGVARLDALTARTLAGSDRTRR